MSNPSITQVDIKTYKQGWNDARAFWLRILVIVSIIAFIGGVFVGLSQ